MHDRVALNGYTWSHKSRFIKRHIHLKSHLIISTCVNTNVYYCSLISLSVLSGGCSDICGWTWIRSRSWFHKSIIFTLGHWYLCQWSQLGTNQSREAVLSGHLDISNEWTLKSWGLLLGIPEVCSGYQWSSTTRRIPSRLHRPGLLDRLGEHLLCLLYDGWGIAKSEVAPQRKRV